MGSLFISHSRADNEEALRVRDYLFANGWTQIFVDLDPEQGIAPGHLWRQELKRAGEQCSGVVLLLSSSWLASRWCQTEFLVADQLGKQIFPLLIAPVSQDDLPYDLKDRLQIADASTAEKREDGLRRLLVGIRRAGLDPNSFPWPPRDEPNRSVYRGLESLEEQDAAIFFGRDAQLTKAMDAIRRLKQGAPERIIVVLGASGAGKSSFLKAGLIPRLKRDENFIVLPVIRPERAAITGRSGLSAAFQLDPVVTPSTSEIASCCANFRNHAVESRMPYAGERMATPPATPSIIIPLDQAEELFLPENKEAQQARELLSALLRLEPSAILVATIRSDSFELLQKEAAFAEIPMLIFNLSPLPLGAFKEVIDGPARLANPPVLIEPALCDQLLSDLAEEDALPLLAFTLQRLCASKLAGGKLTLSQYRDEFGGLQGAILAAVDAAFQEARKDPELPKGYAELEALARSVFIPALVHLEGPASEPRRRVEKYASLPLKAKPLVRHLVNQRLLVCQKMMLDGADVDSVEVTHEAILRQWPAVRSWIAEERGALYALEAARLAAFEWDRHAGAADPRQSCGLVHKGARLEEAEALALRIEFSSAVDDSLRNYLGSCRREENSERLREQSAILRTRRLQRITWGVLSAIAAVVLLTGALILELFRGLTGQSADILARHAADRAAEQNYDSAARYALMAYRGAGWGPFGRSSLIAGPELEGAAAASSAVSLLRGHKDQVLSARFSKDGRWLISASRDGTAILWDVKASRQASILRAGSAALRDAVLSPNGNRIATASEDGKVSIWLPGAERPIFTLAVGSAVSTVVFSPDGSKLLAAVDDGTTRVWDARSGSALGIFKADAEPVNSAAWSADGRLIVIASQDETARIWDANTHIAGAVLRGHRGVVNTAEFGSNDTRVVTASDDETARIWDAKTGRQISTLEGHTGGVRSATFDARSRYVATASVDRTVRLWSARTSREIASFRGHENAVNTVSFAPDDQLASASDDSTVRVWHAAPPHSVLVLQGHTAPILGAKLNIRRGFGVTASTDKTLRFWNPFTGEELGKIYASESPLEDVGVTRDGSRAVSASDDGVARIWDLRTHNKIAELRGHTQAVNSADFSPDGSRVVTGSVDGTARVWNSGTGASLLILRGHKGGVYSAKFSHDGKQVVTASSDQTAIVWDALTGKKIVVLHGPKAKLSSAEFSPDGRKIVAGARDGTLTTWDAQTRQAIWSIRGHSAAIISAAYNGNGTQIVTASADKTVRIWDAETGRDVAVMRGHLAAVNSANFSTDGRWLITGSDDGTARIWKLSSVTDQGRAVTARICSTTLAHGLARFSKEEIRSASSALNALNEDACGPPHWFTRLKELFLNEF